MGVTESDHNSGMLARDVQFIAANAHNWAVLIARTANEATDRLRTSIDSHATTVDKQRAATEHIAEELNERLQAEGDATRRATRDLVTVIDELRRVQADGAESTTQLGKKANLIAVLLLVVAALQAFAAIAQAIAAFAPK